MKIEGMKIAGIPGYVQCADASRWTPPDAQGWMTSTVLPGDRWQPGGNTSDDRKALERCEFRSLDEDQVGGPPVEYVLDLLIPADYPELSPKQTFAQGFADDHPAWFVRYERTRLEFCLNYGSTLNRRWAIPHVKGKPVRLVVLIDYKPGPDAGAVRVTADGMVVCDEQKVSMVEKGAKSVYWKHGIYRSGMDRYTGPSPAPAQTVRHRLLSRTVLDRVSDATKPAPVPTPAATPIPSPTKDGSLFARMAMTWTELNALAQDVEAVAPSSGKLVRQAAERLQRAGAQFQKASGKGKAT